MSGPIAWPIGCGVDVVERDRFELALKRSGEAFLARVFTRAERRRAKQRRDWVMHLAARFAGKEAVVKAVAQVDPLHPLVMSDIEILNDALGRPYVVLRRRGVSGLSVHVSLSHAERIAMASAVAMRSPGSAQARDARRTMTRPRSRTTVKPGARGRAGRAESRA